MAALSSQIALAKSNTTYFGQLLADVVPENISSRSALAGLPVTRKGDLLNIQKSSPPFGGMTTVAPNRLSRLYLSPGPIYDAEGLNLIPGALRVRFMRQAFERAISCITASLIISLQPV